MQIDFCAQLLKETSWFNLKTFRQLFERLETLNATNQLIITRLCGFAACDGMYADFSFLGITFLILVID